jgi:anti-sigma factor RsiW
MADGHDGEELQDLLDGRLDIERAGEVRLHLDHCPECRRELETLAWTRRAVAAAAPADLPAGLEGAIRAAIGRAEEPGISRRVFLAAAAGVLLGSAGALWVLRRSRVPLPAAVARDYARFRAGALPLESTLTRADALEAFFRERGIPFRTRVLDLAMMRYQLAGGRAHRLGGRPSALFVYRGEAGRTLLCQMYEAHLQELPPPADVRDHRGFRFQVYREGDVTVVFWQEGAVVCVLAGDFGEREVLALAFEKAML